MEKLARIDLSTRSVEEEKVSEAYKADFIGGSGLGLRIAYDEIGPTSAPLGRDNKLIFMTGPLTGTILGTAGRFQVIFKSPLTGLMCDSSCSGLWGSSLKTAGYDGIIIQGVSEVPVYLYITEEGIKFLDAKKHWGKDTETIQEDLKKELTDPKAQIVAIGPAGEKGVLYSSLITAFGRAAARGGAGAVMGSKNLKAIVVRGNRKVELNNPEGYNSFAKELNRRNSEGIGLQEFRKYGTPMVFDSNWVVSDIPFKNWALGSTKDLCENLGGKKVLEIMPKKPNTCYRCTVGCNRWIKTEYKGIPLDIRGPEYESLAALGSLCMIFNLPAVAYANRLCDLYGMDTISCGSTLAFTMECMEKGLLKSSDLDGINLTWGNETAQIEMIHKIGKGEGAGTFLGLGTKRMAEKIGKDSMDFAVHVKGMEIPMHDPRGGFGWATAYATNPRGGCHLKGMTDWFENVLDPIPEWGFLGQYERMQDDGKPEMAFFANTWSNIVNSLVVCYFATFLFKPSDICKLLFLATNNDYSPKDLLKIGTRINTLHRSYNYLCGSRRKDDSLPPRSLMPLKEGGAAGKVPNLEKQLERYYSIRKWNADGKPSKELLIDSNLQDIVPQLY